MYHITMFQLFNKIKKEPKFNAREVNKLVEDGWVVEGDRTWASRNGDYCLPSRKNLFKKYANMRKQYINKQ